jgi:hypothetical protein
MKASIIKAVTWNSRQYLRPSGDQATGGYPAKHGFGHEEWNNSPAMLWRGYRIFHTERRDRLLEYSRRGELGMLMMVSREKKQLAVGVAAGVFDNTDADRELIADELGMYDKWRELWDLPLVRNRFGNNQQKFLTFWADQHKWLSWKVEPRLYHWFERPLSLDAQKLTGKQRLGTHFGTYQPLRPELIAALVRGKVAQEIVEWFEESDFDPHFYGPNKDRSRQKRSDGLGPGSKANSPATRAVQYWVYGERKYEPLHHELQARYVQFLKRKQLQANENDDYVDVRYKDGGAVVFAELKPTEVVPPRFAIRMAVGQLLEHRHRLNAQAKLVVVLSTKPEASDVDFVKSLGIGLTYWSGSTFVTLS